MVRPEIEQFQKALLPPSVDAFSPAWIIGRFRKCVESYGLDSVTDHRIFQKLRDLQVGALFSLGLSKARQDREHWTTSVPEKEQTPDIYMYSFGQHPNILGGLRLEKLRVELKEWDHHNEENVREYLKLLLAKKKYPKNFHIVVYANKQGRELDLPLIAKQVIESRISGAWIWLLTTFDTDSETDSYVLACLNRKPGQIDFRLSEELMKHQGQLQAIKLRRGKFRGAPDFKDFVDVSMPKLTPTIKEILFQSNKRRKNDSLGSSIHQISNLP